MITKFQFLSKANTTLLLLLASLTFVQAQGGAGSVKFSVVTWKDLSLSPIFYRQGSEAISLELSPGNRSELYSLEGATMLGLFTLVETEENKQEYQIVGKASILPGVSRMLFFVTETNEPGKLPLSLLGMDDSLLTFPRGACRFVNFTEEPLNVTFGERTSKIQPKGMTVVRSGVSPNGALLPFWVKDSSGRNLYENRFFAQEIGRDMIFIFPPSSPGGRVNVKLLPQLIAHEPVNTEE